MDALSAMTQALNDQPGRDYTLNDTIRLLNRLDDLGWTLVESATGRANRIAAAVCASNPDVVHHGRAL